MAYDTWEWPHLTGSGQMSEFDAVRRRPLVRNSTEAGYIERAPSDVRGSWLFRLEFSLLRPWSYIYLAEFFDEHPGIPFYFRWPFEMAGIPPEAEIAAPGGVHIWDSEVVPLAGYGPTFLVFWDQDEFPVRYKKKLSDNYWQVTGAIELRQT